MYHVDKCMQEGLRRDRPWIGEGPYMPQDHQQYGKALERIKR